MSLVSRKFLSDKNIGWLVFGILVFFWVIRAPNLLFMPRIWAEEGSAYLTNAYYNGFFKSLFFLPKYTAGYFNLCASIPSEIASMFFSLEYIPSVFTYFSLSFYLICLYRIVFGDFIIFQNRYQNWILAVCLVFFVPATGTFESWANTINLQLYCGIYAVLIVLTKNDWYHSRRRLVVDSLILLLCVLSGPYAVFIGFAFLLKLYYNRTRINLIFASILILGALLQGSAYLYLSYNDFLSTKKTITLSWDTIFAGVFRYFFLDPILGEQNTIGLLKLLNLYYTKNQIINGDRFIRLAFLGIVFIITSVFSIYKNHDKKNFFITSSFYIPVLILVPYFAMYGMSGGRYSVLPTFLVALLLISLLNKHTNIILKNIVVIILMVGVFFGAGEFWSTKKKYFAGDINTMPNWENEIKNYRMNKGN